MSEAVARKGGQATAKASPAGQLSDDIGDVLASIRRMISQDSAPRPVQRLDGSHAPAAVLRLDGAAMAPEADDTPDQPTQASGMSHRNGDGASPLRLGAAERVKTAPENPPSPETAGEVVPDGDAGLQSPPPDLPVAACPATAGEAKAEPLSPEPVERRGTAEDASDAADGPCLRVVAGAEDDRPAEPLLADGDARAAAASPLGQLPAEPEQSNGLSVQPGESADAITLSTPAIGADMPETTPAAHTPEPMPAPLMEPAMTTAANPAEDDTGASIFSTMIRDMIRQELHGDPSGRMSRDLRAMVLREVALAMTGQKPAAG